MSEYRIEEDVLGKVKVPADKYWKSQTQRSLENFPIGKETMPKSLLYAFSLLKEACARANASYGKITHNATPFATYANRFREANIWISFHYIFGKPAAVPRPT